jgi:hypothetical protein
MPSALDSIPRGKQLYLASEDTSGNCSSNYQQEFGTWSVPAGQGNGPPSIPLSFTGAAPNPTCNNISGQWFNADSFGNSIGWDLNQIGTSVTGTLSFDDYRDFGSGLTYCGTIRYSASGVQCGTSFSLTASNPVPSVDDCGLPVASSEGENVTLFGQACGTGVATFTISGGGATPGVSRARTGTAVNLAARPSSTTGLSNWTTVSPRSMSLTPPIFPWIISMDRRSAHTPSRLQVCQSPLSSFSRETLFVEPTAPLKRFWWSQTSSSAVTSS